MSILQRCSAAPAALIACAAVALAVLPPDVYKKRIEQSQVKSLAVVEAVKATSEHRGILRLQVAFKAVDLGTLELTGQRFAATCSSLRKGATPPVGGTLYYHPKPGDEVFVTVDRPGGAITSYTPVTARLVEALRRNPLTVVPGMSSVHVQDGSDQLIRQAQKLTRAGKFDEAEELFARAITTNTSYDRVYYHRAFLRLARKKPAEAVADLRKATELNPTAGDACNSLAWELLTCQDAACRDPKAALPLAQKAVKLDRNAPSLDTLACALAASGDFEKAVATAKEALAALKDERLRAELEGRLAGFQEGKDYFAQQKEGAKGH